VAESVSGSGPVVSEAMLLAAAEAFGGVQGEKLDTGSVVPPPLSERIRAALVAALSVDRERDRQKELEEMTAWASSAENPLWEDGWGAGYQRGLGERDRLVEENERLREIIHLLEETEPDECSFDHHGYCQAHGWMATEPRCPHVLANEALSSSPTEER